MGRSVYFQFFDAVAGFGQAQSSGAGSNVRLGPNALSIARLILPLMSIVAYQAGIGSSVLLMSIVMGIFTDFLDGYIARRFKSESWLGHRLDIVADASCFGVLPCFWILSSGTGHGEDLVCAALMLYAIVRIRRGWRCIGIPLPVVGTALFVIYFVAPLSWATVAIVVIIVAAAFHSLTAPVLLKQCGDLSRTILAALQSL